MGECDENKSDVVRMTSGFYFTKVHNNKQVIGETCNLFSKHHKCWVWACFSSPSSRGSASSTNTFQSHLNMRICLFCVCCFNESSPNQTGKNSQYWFSYICVISQLSCVSVCFTVMTQFVCMWCKWWLSETQCVCCLFVDLQADRCGQVWTSPDILMNILIHRPVFIMSTHILMLSIHFI